MSKCIVLNADMTILGTTDHKRAIRLVVTGKAESLVDTDRQIHPEMFIPAVIRLVKAIRMLWKKKVPWSKQNVHVRDKFKCQYCGVKVSKQKATIDHVKPQAQGGKNTWENCVCACFKCNNFKEDRTPEQAEMFLIKQPVAPTIMEFIYKKIKAEGLEGVLKELGVY
jgi:5-methylcytosine-specific restriction endonuclease McrA